MELQGIINDSCTFETIILSDVSTTCRTCLGSSTSFLPLYETCIDNVLIVDLLKSYLLLKLEKNESLPQNICEKCVGLLAQFHRFVKESRENESILHLFLEPSEDNNKEKFNRTGPLGDEYLSPPGAFTEEIKLEIESSDFVGDKLEQQLSGPTSDLEYNSFPLECVLEDVQVDRNTETQVSKFEGKVSLCDICGMGFLSPLKLDEHMRSHDGNRPYQCKLCARGFSLESNLSRHLRSHPDHKRYLCNLCDKSFIQLHSLKSHMKVHSKPIAREKPVPNRQRNLFNLKGDTLASLKSPINQHDSPKEECPICHTTFNSKNGLRFHMRVHTGEKPFKCDQCDKSFRNSSSYYVHKRLHDGVKPYKCVYCSLNFRQRQNLRAHIRTRHTGEKPYECPYCEKKFALSGNFKVHVRLHTDETPCVCEVCGAGFIDSHGLERHVAKLCCTKENSS